MNAVLRYAAHMLDIEGKMYTGKNVWVTAAYGQEREMGTVETDYEFV